MSFKRLFPLLILLVLAGCYQEVPDAFEPVSLSVAQAIDQTPTEEQPLQEEPSPTVEAVVVDPAVTETPTEDFMPFMPTETPIEDFAATLTAQAFSFFITETPTEDFLATLTAQAAFFMPTATPTEVVIIIVPATDPFLATVTAQALFQAFTATPTPDPFALPTNTPEPLFGAFTETPTSTATPTPDPFALPTNTPEPLFGAFTETPSPTPTVVVMEIIVTSTPFGTPFSPVQATPTLVGGEAQVSVITPRPPIQMLIPSLTPDINRGDGTFGTIGTTVPLPGQPTFTPVPATEDERCFYVVRSGDTLFRISQNNNVRLNDLLAANGLNDRSIIQPGQRLRLPIQGCTQTGANLPAPSPAPLVTSTSLPVGTTSYTVQSGDTLAQIARRFNTTIEAIVQANALANPNRLSVGQTLIIPTGGR
ncbi:MAG: LysM peptidoglycan-binding domain-containing protein [Anaerolineae bacterium]|nr:LysM peptidoglycan-binding domain-containing protein [Anaerolineae bacterium]